MRTLDKPLVFVDIETTGLSPARERVIEVAAIRVEHGKVVDEFNQLVNPEKTLPYFITNLTGIREQDLDGAPVFASIVDELYRILDGAIFVAHNVRFDHSFLQQEFNRVGMNFNPEQLCTMRLSRALYPQHSTHKLANLIERHGFTYAARHRAYDDAHVLWQFLQHVGTSFAPDALDAATTKIVGA